jgi:hypothetical protein
MVSTAATGVQKSAVMQRSGARLTYGPAEKKIVDGRRSLPSDQSEYINEK